MWLAVPGVFCAQALIVSFGLAAEHPPGAAELSNFPPELGLWKKAADQPVDAAIKSQLGADRLMERVYERSEEVFALDFLVAWFQSQRGGKTQPHSPQVCLPGSGWVPDSMDVVHLDTAAGPIAANRYVVTSSVGQRAVVLYWYQTPRRVLTGEWESKWWLIGDAFRDHRTDTSLVRIVAWASKGLEPLAADRAAEFARLAYPQLRDILPR
jgi:EpsI family protein